MIVRNPTESSTGLDEVVMKGKRIFTSAMSMHNDAEKLAACKRATMFFEKSGLADVKIGDMATVIVAVSNHANAVYVLSPVGWVNVTNATAMELAEVALGIAPQDPPQPTARQVFNPTGSLVGDLFMAVLAGVGEAVTKTK